MTTASPICRGRDANSLNDSRRSVGPAASICSSSSNTRKMRPLPRPGDDSRPSPLAERQDRQPIEMREPDVAERRRDPPRHVELRRLRHRSAGVEHQVDRQILLLVEEPQQQPVQALVGLPVDVAEVVAGGVRPVIGELEPAPALGRQPIGAVLPGERPLRDDVEVFQLLEEVVFEAEGHGIVDFRLLMVSTLCSAGLQPGLKLASKPALPNC